jgi:hypothetical protein
MAGILGDDLNLGGEGEFGSEPKDVPSVGKISGQMLGKRVTDTLYNLERNGIDLAFDTNLMYLKVGPYRAPSLPENIYEDGDPSGNALATGRGIGINIDGFSNDLTVNGSAHVSSNLTAIGSTATFSNIVFNNTNNISSVTGNIVIAPTGVDAFVRYGEVRNTALKVKDNYIQATGTNQSIVLDASGTGRIEIQSNTNIAGNLSVGTDIIARSDVTIAGQLIIGNNPIDTVTVNTDFTQTIEPGVTNLYDLGSSDKKWRTLYLNGSVNVTSAIITDLRISDQTSFSGNTITSIRSNDNLNLFSNTGIIEIEDLTIENNVISNTLNTPLTFKSTGRGYVEFDSTNAIAIPIGDISQRPFGEIGETRWNTDLQYLECFDGSIYQVATGGGTVVTATIMQELGEIYSLILG